MEISYGERWILQKVYAYSTLGRAQRLAIVSAPEISFFLCETKEEKLIPFLPSQPVYLNRERKFFFYVAFYVRDGGDDDDGACS